MVIFSETLWLWRARLMYTYAKSFSVILIRERISKRSCVTDTGIRSAFWRIDLFGYESKEMENECRSLLPLVLTCTELSLQISLLIIVSFRLVSWETAFFSLFIKTWWLRGNRSSLSFCKTVCKLDIIKRLHQSLSKRNWRQKVGINLPSKIKQRFLSCHDWSLLFCLFPVVIFSLSFTKGNERGFHLERQVNHVMLCRRNSKRVMFPWKEEEISSEITDERVMMILIRKEYREIKKTQVLPIKEWTWRTNLIF